MRHRTVIALAAVVALMHTRAGAQDSCGTCHPDVRTEYEQGIHAKQLGCTDCHGGDPTITKLESHSKEKGYVGKPSRLDIPALCGTCHGSPERVKSFGLITDQYAQYKTSEHGILLAQGDARVAVCTDCHGTHHILSAQEPTSPVARRNVPTTCAQCHSDRVLMSDYDLRTDQEVRFRQSVHGVALFVVEHPDAPTCATCHSAHGASVVAAGMVGNVCGHCHSRTRQYLNEGPHRAATEAGKMSECESCHGYHDTTHPTRDLFDTACLGCHEQESPAFAVGQKLKTLLSRAEESVAAAERDMVEAQKTFPTITHYRPRLQQGQASLMEAMTVQHSLDLERTEDLTRSARSISEDVQASVHGVGLERQLRYLNLAIVWTVLLFTVGVAYLYKREARRGRQTPDAGHSAG